MPIAGTLLNVAAIALGALVGLSTRKDLTTEWQGNIRKILGALLIWLGWVMIWKGINGSFRQVCLQIGILLLSLIIGRIIGRLLHLQAGLNHLGQYARRQLSLPPEQARQFAPGFLACTIIYCAAPLAVVGGLQEGLNSDPKLLIIKALMDGLAMVAFARFFGHMAVFSVIPLLVYQGAFGIIGQNLEPFLHQHNLIDAVSTAAGYIVICVSLVVLEFKKISLSDYLPALGVAPLVTWWLR